MMRGKRVWIIAMMVLAGPALSGVSSAQQEQSEADSLSGSFAQETLGNEVQGALGSLSMTESPAAPEPPVSETVEPAAPEPAPVTEPAAATEPVPPAAEIPAQAEGAKAAEWVWGEVVSVDAANKQLVIKHLDYETYEEVQTTLTLNDKTLLENVAGLNEIKPGDYVTVDYTREGSANIVGLVVVEKKEAAPAEALSAQGPAMEAPASEAPAPEAPAVEAPAAEVPVAE